MVRRECLELVVPHSVIQREAVDEDERRPIPGDLVPEPRAVDRRDSLLRFHDIPPVAQVCNLCIGRSKTCPHSLLSYAVNASQTVREIVARVVAPAMTSS